MTDDRLTEALAAAIRSVEGEANARTRQLQAARVLSMNDLAAAKLQVVVRAAFPLRLAALSALAQWVKLLEKDRRLMWFERR